MNTNKPGSQPLKMPSSKSSSLKSPNILNTTNYKSINTSFKTKLNPKPAVSIPLHASSISKTSSLIAANHSTSTTTQPLNLRPAPHKIVPWWNEEWKTTIKKYKKALNHFKKPSCYQIISSLKKHMQSPSIS